MRKRLVVVLLNALSLGVVCDAENFHGCGDGVLLS